MCSKTKLKPASWTLELQSHALETENFFIKMFPAQNVEEARVKADEMRPIPLMLH